MWEDVFAGIAGGVDAGLGMYQNIQTDRARREDSKIRRQQLADKSTLEQQAQEIRMLIAQLNESGRNARFTEGEEGKNTRAEAANTTRKSIAELREDNARKIATMRNDTTLRGQDITSADRRYGVDLGASTARRGQDIAAGTARRGQDMRYDISLGEQELQQWNDIMDAQLAQGSVWNAYKRARAADPTNPFGATTPQDQEEMPNFDSVFAPIPSPGPPPNVGRSSAGVSAGPEPPARPPRPAAPRPAAAPAPGRGSTATPGKRLSSGRSVGDEVTLADGRRGVITGETPDGKLRIRPLK